MSNLFMAMSCRNRILRVSKQVFGLRKYSEFSVSSELAPMQNFQTKVPIKHKLEKITESRYGGRFIVTMIIGIGLGPELTEIVEDIFKHALVPVDLERIEVLNMDDVEYATKSIKRNGSALKTNIEGSEAFQIRTTDLNPNVSLRQDLDLYLNMIHCRPYSKFVTAKYSGIDVVLIRQNTEGEYAMLEHESVKGGVIQSLKVITKYNSERIALSAFRYATENNRKKVTIVHKANIMKLTDGLFLKTALDVAKQFPNITVNSMLVDNACMQLVNHLEQFDVLLLPNLYGSICSNIVSGLLGGPGLYAESNYGPHYAVFESASRSIGFSIFGKNVANPIAMLNAACDLLDHLQLIQHSALIQKAIHVTLTEDKIFTADLGGEYSTTDVVESIKNNISKFRKMYTTEYGGIHSS